MNFKLIIILFNGIAVLFLALMALLPFAILGKELALMFWQNVWFFAPVLLLILGGIDLYCIHNGRIFMLLEKEDWPALVLELEDRVFRKERYTAHLVKLLANSYLVLSDPGAVHALEKKLATVKPALINANVLVFGAARLLTGNAKSAVEFFTVRLPDAVQSAGIPAAARDWLSFYCGFALLVNRQFTPAAERFSALARESGDCVTAALSAYFLDTSVKKFLPLNEYSQAARDGKARITGMLKTRAAWNREIKRIETEVHAAVLVHYLSKTANYLYAAP
ncbi:MAG: hypothetical protein LBC88_10185 [Spirochaetaceae bacterium]|nr:hypothetical protein [Spirochaetaceae bacterium]